MAETTPDATCATAVDRRSPNVPRLVRLWNRNSELYTIRCFTVKPLAPLIVVVDYVA
jgi:hypothetical protein